MEQNQKDQRDACLIYARKSVKKDKEYSIPAQLKHCREYAEKNNFKIVKEFTEMRSGWKGGKRIDFFEMLELVTQIKIDHLLFYMTDRAYRNLDDYQDLHRAVRASEIYNKENDVYITFHIVNDNKKFRLGHEDDYDAICDHEKAIIDGKREVARSRKRTIDALEEKLEKGEPCDLVPLGYINCKITGKVIPDRDRWDLVRKLWDLAQTGEHSYSDLAKIMNSMGLTSRKGTPMYKQRIEYILSRTFYYGYFKFKGKNAKWKQEIWSNRGINNDVDPTYEIMITKAEYDRVQEIYSSRRSNWTVSGSKRFLFKGVFRCAQCGRSLLGEEKKIEVQGKPKSIFYYSCKNGHFFVDKSGSIVGKQFVDRKTLTLKEIRPNLERFGDDDYREVFHGKIGDPVTEKKCRGILPLPKEEELEAAILEQLDFITNPKAVDELKGILDHHVKETKSNSKLQLSGISRQLSKIDTMMNRLWEIRLDPDSEISEPDFKVRLEHLQNKRNNLTIQKRDFEDENDISTDEAFEILEVCKSIKAKYLASDMDMRNKIIKKIARSVFVWPRDPEFPSNLSMQLDYNEPFTIFHEEGFIKRIKELSDENYGIFPKTKKWLLG